MWLSHGPPNLSWGENAGKAYTKGGDAYSNSVWQAHVKSKQGVPCMLVALPVFWADCVSKRLKLEKSLLSVFFRLAS